jgi:hypothetical protein
VEYNLPKGGKIPFYSTSERRNIEQTGRILLIMLGPLTFAFNIYEEEFHITKLLVTSLLITLLMTGCGQTLVNSGSQNSIKENVSFTNKTVIGQLQNVYAGQYDDWYYVTLKKMNKVGKKIGVTNNGTNMKPFAVISSGPSSLGSNVLPVGTPVYEIPKVNPKNALIVVWKGQYVEAVKTTKRPITLPDKTVLSWNKRLYRVTTPIDATDVGQVIGTVSYHGKSFTVLKFDDLSPAQTVVFRSSTGDYFKALGTNKLILNILHIFGR